MLIIKRLALILAITVLSHILVIIVKRVSKYFLQHRATKRAKPKLVSIISLFTSVLIFVIYFLAIGYSLKELGVSLTAYIASASVIGLAVAFGSQGIVQDTVQGITLIISNQINLGDMVEVNGQTGIIKSIGMRFVVFENALGAEVFIPNRNINVVIRYPKKYLSCYIDIIMNDSATEATVVQKVKERVKQNILKYPGIYIEKTAANQLLKKTKPPVLRIILKIWPGRGTVIETQLKHELMLLMKSIDPSFTDAMLTVNYEIEKDIKRTAQDTTPGIDHL